MTEKKEVIFQDFVNEVRRELHFHLDGGTYWRQVTSALALVTALEIGKIEAFKTREGAIQSVRNMFPALLSEERIMDVGKMLHVIFQDLNFKIREDDNVKQYVQQKRSERKDKKLGLKKLE